MTKRYKQFTKPFNSPKSINTKTIKGDLIMENTNNICPICNLPVLETDSANRCEICGALYHQNCWALNNGCATIGCANNKSNSYNTIPTNNLQANPEPVYSSNSTAASYTPNLSAGEQPAPSPAGVAVASPYTQNQVQQPTIPTQSSNSTCQSCGTQLNGQQFCPNCGTNAFQTAANSYSTPATPQQLPQQPFIQTMQPKAKTKTAPIIIAVVVLLAIVGGIFGYNQIQKNNKKEAIAEYVKDAKTFQTTALTSGVKLEAIAKTIRTYWYSYVSNGTYSSVDGAVSAALLNESSNVSSVKTSKATLESLYSKLSTIPDGTDKELGELKTAVKDAYDAYNQFHNYILNPSGNYYTFISQATQYDSTCAAKIKNLYSLLQKYDQDGNYSGTSL